MSAHVLLNLLNELGKRDKMQLAEHFISFSQRVNTSCGKEIKCKACRAFYLFFATSLINSIIKEHVC